MATTPARKTSAAGAGLKRSLTVWAAVGLSLALMAPSMAANINPQGASGAGRAVPLAFLIAAVGVLLVIPIAAIVVLGYTLYRNVYPYPSGDGSWFPIAGGAWLAAAILAVLLAPGTARKLGPALAIREGMTAAAPEGTVAADS
jgi:hypothetical protein